MSANALRLRLSSLAVSCTSAGCKRSLPTMRLALSQVCCQDKEKKNEPHKVRFFRLWCGQQDLNLHEPNAHKNLNLARLPIPPCPHSFAILAYPRRNVNSFGQFGQNVVNFQKYRPSRRLSSQKTTLIVIMRYCIYNMNETINQRLKNDFISSALFDKVKEAQTRFLYF